MNLYCDFASVCARLLFLLIASFVTEPVAEKNKRTAGHEKIPKEIVVVAVVSLFV